MQNSNYQKKRITRNSANREMKQGFDAWLRGLRSIEQIRQDRSTLPPGTQEPRDQNIRLSAEDS